MNTMQKHLKIAQAQWDATTDRDTKFGIVARMVFTASVLELMDELNEEVILGQQSYGTGEKVTLLRAIGMVLCQKSNL